MIPGIKVLLEGEGGTGKTTSIKTLADAGLEVFGIFTGDPGMQSATDDPRVHYVQIPPASVPWTDLRDMASKSNTLTTDALAKYTGSRRNYTQLLQVLDACNDYKCERCGKSFGDVGSWSTDRVLVLDNLSGLSKMARYLIVGGRTYISQPELWNAQGNVARILDKLALDLKCHFVLIAHIDGDRDELTGQITYLPSTPELGKALRTTFSVNFSDVILAKRQGNKFTWSTMETRYFGLKGINTGWVEDQPQDFRPIIERWKSRGGKVEKSE
ncbi:MAG: AAA family ATPase [Deltaproteobacteria bacterium]|nr:AAA family ATPase [Deltaproteobacteria bacterium]